MPDTIEKVESVGVEKKDGGKGKQVVLEMELGHADACPKKSLSTKEQREKLKNARD